VQEVERSNPEIAPSLHTWRAATNLPKQASALPETQITFQQFSVGSPRPSAGFSNSDFAYAGIGASQDLPHPGKRRLRSEVAAREAYEEAGLVGSITSKHPIGIYHYEKQFAEGGLLCEVQVFLFRVDQQLDDWPEKGQRQTRWLDPTEAAALVNEGGLAEVVRVASYQLRSLPRKADARLPRALLPTGIHPKQR